MKAVLTLGLAFLSLTAHAREPQVQQRPHTAQAQAELQVEPVAAESSFSQQSQSGPAQLPDVNEQEGVDSLMPSFAKEPQNQAMMLGGLLAMGFLIRRRREE